jgi:hypothetical protein
MIAVTRLHGSYEWFESEMDYWILDQRSWAEAYAAAGHGHHDEDFSDRFDIDVVNERNAEEFLSNMRPFRVPQETLRARLERSLARSTDWFDVVADMPVLYVDFDGRRLWSLDSEHTSLVDHAPEGWTAVHASFLEELPVDCRYWMRDGRNLIPALTNP